MLIKILKKAGIFIFSCHNPKPSLVTSFRSQTKVWHT